MLNAGYTRTTITLPEELLLEIKKRALEERKKIKDVIVEGLILSLGVNAKKFSKNMTASFDLNSLFGIWGKGPSGRSFLKKVRRKLVGFTKLPIKIRNLVKPGNGEVLRFLVDSGALYSVVPAKKLSSLGIKPAFKQSFTLANGETVEWPVGNALFEYQGKKIASPVIFGKKDNVFLLGVTTLESFGFILDPITRELRKVPMLLMTIL